MINNADCQIDFLSTDIHLLYQIPDQIHIGLLKHWNEFIAVLCLTKWSAHLLIIPISSHSYIKRKQPQRSFLQYSSSVTMINIVKKYHLRRKIHKLNTLMDLFTILSYKHRIICCKHHLFQNNYWWLLPLFC